MVLAGLAGLARRRVLDGGGGVHLGGQPVRGRRSARSTRSAARSSRNPAAETAELAEMYVAKGLDPELAAEVARQIHATSRPPSPCTPARSSASTRTTWPRPMLAAGLVVPVVRGRRAAAGAAVPARRRHVCARRSSLTLRRAVRLRRRGDAGHQPDLVVRRPAADAPRRGRGRPDLRRSAAWSAAPGSADPAAASGRRPAL